MSPFLLLILFLLIVAGVYGYRMYRINMQKQNRAKKRNQYNDRV